MKNKTKTQKGFTILEIILVVAMTILLSSAVLTVYSKFLTRTQLQSHTWRIMDSKNRARIYSATGRDDKSWGVHFETGQYVLFSGATYNPIDPDNEVFDLPNSMDINSINLNGGGSDLIFDKISADTSQYGGISVEDVSSYETNTISINRVGRINKQ